MFTIALFEPEIPPNTGNIIRLAANCGAKLCLIGKMGFSLENRELKRAGLDYHELAEVEVFSGWESFFEKYSSARIFACSTKGKKNYSEVKFKPNDIFLFGPETRGLPKSLLEKFAPEKIIRIPMLPNNRSLNLSNAVAIIAYEAWRQNRWKIFV
jgi:tRNA (cytidine/uridine-2'-O-)-methyltransferase